MKKEVENLAFYGGTPLFDRELHVGRPNLCVREDFLQRVNDIGEDIYPENFSSRFSQV